MNGEPGKGTTVKIYLPRYYGEGAEHLSPIAKPAGELPVARQGETILVVEDDESARNMSVDSLRELGYTVVHASDAARALATLPLQPNLVPLFTDVVMPDMNGRLLAERARESLPTLKVLYTTGYTRNAVVHHGVLDPDVNFLPKPFTLEQLAVKIRNVLDEPGPKLRT